VRDRAEWERFTDPGVVVLMYHSVPASGSAERFKLPRRQLERQMRLLKLMGRRVRPLQACVAAWHEGKMPPPRTVAITFDDGYRDNLTEAWPVLRQMRYPATLFFITGEAESADEMRNAECRVPAEWVRNAPAPTIPHRQPRQVFAFAVSNSLLSWQEACALDGVGFRVESHGITHSDLASLDPDDARTELVESRLELEARLGRPVTIFAYPYGEFNRDLEKLAAEAGYLAAFGTHEGPNNLHTPRYGMKRVEISGHDNLLAFALKIWAGEDPFRRFARKRM
jgi:peptidoglycan/xylan/chitin deacetylase (PgdA/CDA1 family)